MNPVSLSTTAGKVFWASLLGYCLAFGGFHFMSQYTPNRITFEEHQGLFLELNKTICKNGQYCSGIKFENKVELWQRKFTKYTTFIDLQLRGKQSANLVMIQNNYSEFRSKLPWYVRIQFSQNVEIRTVNGKPFKAN